MAELEFGLEEVGLEPVDCGVWQQAVSELFGGRAGDRCAGTEDGLVVAQYLLVADLRVDECHVHRGMAEHLHNRVEPGAAFGELGADSVPESVG